MLESLIRSVAKLKLLKFDARSLYFERALYFAKLDLVSTEVFVLILAYFVKLYASSVLVNFLRDGLWGRVWCSMIYFCEGSVVKHNSLLTVCFSTGFTW